MRSASRRQQPLTSSVVTNPDGHGREVLMASDSRKGGIGGISLGGIIVIIGIVLMFAVSFWLGLVVLLVGLIAFGGFARGRWY